MAFLENPVKSSLTVKAGVFTDCKNGVVSMTQKTAGIFQTCFVQILIKVHMKRTRKHMG